MTEKIALYREVLELEPNSKLFFPLAKMLVGVGRMDEAIATLDGGLQRHPEYLEARLFFIDLLYRQGRCEDCTRQLAALSTMFSSYEGFWLAWAGALASGANPDTAAAMQFLAVSFSRERISFHEVISRGIAALMKEKGSAPPAAKAAEKAAAVPAPPEPAAVPADDDAQAQPQEDAVRTTFEPTPPSRPDVHGDEDGDLPEEEDAPAFAPAPAQPAAPTAPAASSPQDADDEDDGETFTLRTRSMAEVLAEQGDIRGALDIYHELVGTADDEKEHEGLMRRIEELTSRLESPQATSQAPPAPAADSEGKDKMISVLATLAGRMEARAKG